MNYNNYSKISPSLRGQRRMTNAINLKNKNKNYFVMISDNIKPQNYHSYYSNPVYHKQYNGMSLNNDYLNTKYRNTLPSTRRPKKRVKFNEIVDVIMVKSFKKYNKEEESISIGDYFDENYNYKPKKRNKEGKNCECNII